MEKEKLEEAKKTFDEDRDKFDKYMHELQNKAIEAGEQVKQLTQEKNRKL